MAFSNESAEDKKAKAAWKNYQNQQKKAATKTTKKVTKKPVKKVTKRK